MALQEDALRHAGILNTRLNDMESVVFEVVENNAMANAEVFICILNNRLLEVCLELKYLSVILEPLGCNLRNGVIHLWLSVRNTCEAVGLSFAHRLQQVALDFLFEIDSFLCHGAILHTEQLRLVVAGDRRIGIGVPREERQLFG